MMGYKTPQINWGQMGKIGENVGVGMRGGHDARNRRMLQQYLGPQSQAGWAIGTRTVPQGGYGLGNMPQQDMWARLRGMFGR